MLTTADSATSQPVVIVNEAFVRRFLPTEDPIGRRVTFGNPAQADTPWQTIVGDCRRYEARRFRAGTLGGNVLSAAAVGDRRLLVFLRTARDPAALAGAAQSAVWALDPNEAVASVRTVDEMLAQADANRRFTTLLLGAFAAVALLLAAIGVYGVLAYATAQRTQEIGIRMALGADRGMVLRMILAGGVKIARAGLILGIAGALAACWIPARRAVRVEPVLALRGE